MWASSAKRSKLRTFIAIHLDWVFASESSLSLQVNVLKRDNQHTSIVKAIKKTILDYLRKTYGETYGSKNSRDPEFSSRSDKLPYFIQTLNISVKGKIDREKFGEDMCKLIGRDGACKLESTSSTRNSWNAVMVYKGSGGSSSGNVLKSMMMMSLKF